MAVELERAREFHRRGAWGDAREAFRSLDVAAALGGEDLERLADAAFLVGRDDEFAETLDRAHRAHLDAGDCAGAVRCAFWLSQHLLLAGETGRASGWLARGHRVLERKSGECVERGYLELSAAEQHLRGGELQTALDAAQRAAALGERFADADLVAGARHAQGRALIRQGEIAAGLALLDEAMVAVTSGELSPLFTGMLYCSVIAVCRDVYAFGRAREWTFAMTEWCGRQPQLVALRGNCLVHRAEILQIRGRWQQAIEEAQLACEGSAHQRPAAAFYEKAEVHRLRGELADAEASYARASQLGFEPQPGLALLRLARGRTDAAFSALRRALRVTDDRRQRARLLPAYVEVLLAAGEDDEARAACRELEETAAVFQSEMLDAIAAHARGAVELGAGDAQAGAVALRRALESWQRLDAPYLAARSRELIGLACRALGDAEGAELELDAARTGYAELGAAPDLARMGAGPRRNAGLTARELQVLGLIARGQTNRAIAAELGISSRTVDRHVSNIFTKLDVSTRAAATARAYQKDLL